MFDADTDTDAVVPVHQLVPLFANVIVGVAVIWVNVTCLLKTALVLPELSVTFTFTLYVPYVNPSNVLLVLVCPSCQLSVVPVVQL